MIRIDDTLLEEIGLIALPKQDRDQLLRQIYETLEMRVGMRLAERMTDQQLDEFERFIDTNDEAGALKWLESNFPDYKQVVADELEKLKVEIKQDSSKIIETMHAQQQNQPGQIQGAPAPQQFAPQPAPAQTFGQPTAPSHQPSQFGETPSAGPAPQQFAPVQPTQPLQPYNPQPQQDSTAPQNDFSQPQPAPQPQTYQNVPPPPSFDGDDQQPPFAG
jgi:hypothetical protein